MLREKEMRTLADKEYEVYSSVLSTFFDNHPPMSILDRTGYAWRWEELGPEFGDPRIRYVLRKNPELASDFRARNSEVVGIEDRFSAAVEYTIVPSSEGSAGWQFSRIGFSGDERFALVMVAFVGRPKVASGMLVLCEQEEANWSCEKVLEWCS